LEVCEKEEKKGEEERGVRSEGSIVACNKRKKKKRVEVAPLALAGLVVKGCSK